MLIQRFVFLSSYKRLLCSFPVSFQPAFRLLLNSIFSLQALSFHQSMLSFWDLKYISFCNMCSSNVLFLMRYVLGFAGDPVFHILGKSFPLLFLILGSFSFLPFFFSFIIIYRTSFVQSPLIFVHYPAKTARYLA